MIKKNKVKLLTVEWIFLVYIVLGSAFCHLLPLPELVKSILSLPAWLIIPYFLGKIVKLCLQRARVFHVAHRTIVLTLILGVYSLIVSVFLLDLLGLSFILKNLHILILSITFVRLTYETLIKKEGDCPIITFHKLDMLAIVFSLLVSFIPAVISRSVFPFPYGTIETISIPMEQYQPALRFMEYGYIQHYRVYDYVSLGFCSQLFNIDPLSFIWSATFLMMAIFSVGLYLFSFSLFKSRWVALMTVLIGSFLNMNVFRDIPTLFRSNVFMYVFLALALFLSYQSISRKDYKIKDVAITLTLLGAIIFLYIYLIESDIWLRFAPTNLQYIREWRSHVWIPIVLVTSAPVLFIMGHLSNFLAKKNTFMGDNLLLLMLILFFYLALMDSECIAFILFIVAFVCLHFISVNRKTSIALHFFVAIVFTFILFQRYVAELPFSNPISSVIFPEFAKTLEPMPFLSRFQWLFEINLTLTLRIILLLGVAVTLLCSKRENLLAVSAFSLALFFYFFPEAYAYRFFKEVTVTMACVMSVGLNYVFNALVNRRNFYTAIIFSSLIVALLIPNLIIPVYQRHYNSSLGQYIISSYEYDAAKWLRENTPENSLIISDYVTMQLMSPLSNKMLPIPRSYRIQALNYSDQQAVLYIKNMLSGYFDNITLCARYLIEKMDSADKRYCESVNIAWNQSNVLIILTSRTIKWLEQQGTAEIWLPPDEPVDPKFLRLFQESNSLELIYSYETKIYIFRVKM